MTAFNVVVVVVYQASSQAYNWFHCGLGCNPDVQSSTEYFIIIDSIASVSSNVSG